MHIRETKCLGCVYIFPTNKAKFDAEVYMWVRKSHIKFDSLLFSTIKEWMKQKWPFKNIAYPGREILWEDWNKT